MAAEIDKIFTATAKSTWSFLIENGQGCYIPAYQRPYSWDSENITRLFEDVIHGIQQISNRPATISEASVFARYGGADGYENRQRLVDVLPRSLLGDLSTQRSSASF